jgi:hypothetical protein
MPRTRNAVPTLGRGFAAAEHGEADDDQDDATDQRGLDAFSPKGP